MKLSNLININSVKIQNRRIVFNHMEKNDMIPRNELARLSKVSLGTVSTILEEFQKYGIVKEIKDERTTVGRKPNLVQILPSAKKIIVICLTVNHLSFEIQDFRLDRFDGDSIAYDHSSNLRQNLERLRIIIKATLDRLEIGQDDIIGIGVSVPGHYWWQEDRIVNTMYPEFSEQHVKEHLEQYLGKRVTVKNSVRLAASAEVESVADYEDKIVDFIYLGDEVGGAVVIKGEVLPGAHGFSGDIGQIIVEGQDTLEVSVSWHRFICRIPGMDQVADADCAAELLRRLAANDPLLVETLDTVCRYVATALAQVFWLVDPNCIIIAGRYNIFGDYFIEAIRRHLGTLIKPGLATDMCIMFSTLDERSTFIGAGKMMRDFWIRHLT
jgi:predicted NBD/HSP70 family sugar kinase